MSRPLVLLLALSFLPAAAQSFDCKLAQTPREQAVCSSPKLSALDSAVATAYKSLYSQLSPESAALVESDQHEWLHWLDLVCPANGKAIKADIDRCLENEYDSRKVQLHLARHIGQQLIFPRSHFLYVASKTPPNDLFNPGFGYGSLIWPQIDRPNDAQSAFNAAVKTRAQRLAVGWSQDKNATFDTAVDESGNIYGSFTVNAANDRLIDVDLDTSVYGWGAAHPTSGGVSSIWWLDRGRQLTTTDVFLPNSGWQDALVPLAIANLQSQPDIKQWLWKGDELTQGVRSGVTDPRNWALTPNGLTITFGEYGVGPYSIGMPQVHIPWNQLTPYLDPALDPSTLPPASE